MEVIASWGTAVNTYFPANTSSHTHTATFTNTSFSSSGAPNAWYKDPADSTYKAWPGTVPLSTITPAPVAAAGAVGTGTSVSREDHVHATNTPLSTVTPQPVGAVGAVGTGTAVSREDHVHLGAATGAKITLQTAPPSSPAVNDLWVDSDALVQPYAQAPLSGRNAIRNGDMSVWQRGGPIFVPNTTTKTYTADGWAAQSSGATVSVAHGTHTPGNELSDGCRDFLQFNPTSSWAGAAGDHGLLYQFIEDVGTFAGRQVTLSFDASSPLAGAKIGIEIEQNYGSGGSATLLTAVGLVTLTGGATNTRYSVTFTVPSIAGKTIGAGSFLKVNFWWTAGSTYAARASNVGIQNGLFNIWAAQLEAGQYATPFERTPQQQTMALCQRYLHVVGGTAANVVVGTGLTASATSAYLEVFLPVRMRAVPSLTVTGGFNVSDRTVNWAASSFGIQPGSTPDLADINVVSSGMTAQRAMMVYTGVSGGTLIFSAEL
jgi:hypothetical protein